MKDAIVKGNTISRTAKIKSALVLRMSYLKIYVRNRWIERRRTPIATAA